MSSDLLLIYISRVLHILLPPEAGLDFIRTLSEFFLAFIDASLSRRRDLELEVSSQIRSLFAQKGWESSKFDTLLQDIDRMTSVDSIVDYLKSVINNLRHEMSPLPKSRQEMAPPPLPFDIGGGISNLRSSPLHSNAPSGTLGEVIQPYYKTLSDETILQFLPYTLLGLDSKLFVFKDNSVLLPSKLNNSYASLLNQVLELALLFRELKKKTESRSMDLSLIKRLFLSFLNSELNSYSGAVNAIFQNNPSSIIGVLKEIHPKVITLRVLFHLSDKLDIQGDELLTIVYNLTKLGDVEVQKTSSRLFSMMSVPYYEMVEHWLLKGLLVDNLNEFFISFDPQAENINEIIQFSTSRIPVFLTAINKNIGYRIFQIGKMIIFLSKYCKELEWLSTFTGHHTGTIHSYKGLASMTAHQLPQLVNQMYLELLNYMTYVVFYKFELFVHLLNCKRFLLMEASDFIEKIITNGSDIFDEPSISLTSGQLARLLVDSIKSSSVKNLDFRYQSRLDARILELSHGTIGWEVFTLEYKVTDLPINSILSSNGGITNYLKAFNFLWKVRHFTSILNAGFIESCNLRRNDLKLVNRRFSQIKQQMKRAEFLMNLRDRRTYWIIKTFNIVNVVRHEMLGLLEAITYYLSYDVIEDSFQRQLLQKFFKSRKGSGWESGMPVLSTKFRNHISEFQKQQVDAGERSGVHTELDVHEYNLDELVDIHTSYLLSIVRSRLLDGDVIGKMSGRSFVAQIYLFLEMMFQYANSWDQYAVLLVNYVGIVSLEKGLTQEAPGSEDIMELDDDLERNEESLQILTHKIYTELYLGQFKPQRDAFVRDLKSDNELRTLGRSL